MKKKKKQKQLDIVLVSPNGEIMESLLQDSRPALGDFKALVVIGQSAYYIIS